MYIPVIEHYEGKENLKMSMTDELRRKVEKKKSGTTSSAEVLDLLNEAMSKSLKQYLIRLNAGEIPIDNIADLQRVFGMFKEANNIEEALEGNSGAGALPEISMKVEKAIDEQVQKGKMSEDEEGLDVMNMSAEDVAELVRNFDIAQNSENEEAF